MQLTTGLQIDNIRTGITTQTQYLGARTKLHRFMPLLYYSSATNSTMTLGAATDQQSAIPSTQFIEYPTVKK